VESVDQGRLAQPGTEEIVATLDAVLKLNINHPFANHLYIHAVEASQHPDKAVAAADRLRELQPGLAHNVHMPTHIDIRVGQWQKAIDWNAKAIDSAVAYHRISGPPKGLLIFYEAHNYHMLAYAALMTGQRDLAVTQIKAMVASLPDDFVKDFSPMIEGFGAMPDEVMVRFGMWDQILAPRSRISPTCVHQRVPPRRPRHRLRRQGQDHRSPRRAGTVARWAKEDPGRRCLPQQPHARHLHAGQRHDRRRDPRPRGKTDAGLDKLREAVKLEDALHYDEPPAWMIPGRHVLGAALMRFEKAAEAEQVYRADLAKLPDNGWSLFGLAQALKAQGKTDEAATYQSKFEKVWARPTSRSRAPASASKAWRCRSERLHRF